jgi:hypothetical protein
MQSRVKTPLPTATTPNNLVCLLWDDLNPDDADNPGAHVYVDTDGSRCVVQYADYSEYNGDVGDVMTAEIILYADGTIKLQYQSFGTGFDTESGAIGIENHDGTDGLEVAYATSYLHDELAVTFIKPYQWLELDKYSGLVDPGGADTVLCSISAGTLDSGVYLANIVVHSNDPNTQLNPMTVPVEMTVGGSEPPWICADVDNNGSPADIGDLVYLVDFMFNDGPVPDYVEAADLNGSGGNPDIEDLIVLVDYMFADGPEPTCSL